MDDDKALLMQISFDLKRLQNQAKQAEGITDKSLTAMEKRAKKAARELEESFSLKNIRPGEAMVNVLSGLKGGAVEEGAAQLGVLGGALEALGPAGIVAGAGIAAVGFAIERSMKTAEWAEDLKRASAALGLTTTTLQEFDFFAKSTGIPVEKMRESLSGLEKTIGLVESGLARSMTVKAFTDGLKITPEQLRGWGTLKEQLPHILDAAAKLNIEERAGLASRLKVDPEVLTSMVNERDKMRELIATAHEYGIVMDQETIKKSAEAAEKMHVAKTIIDGELNVAFVQLAPVVAGAAGKLVTVATAIGDIMRAIHDVFGPLSAFVGLLDKIPGFNGKTAKPGGEAGAAGSLASKDVGFAAVGNRLLTQQFPLLGVIEGLRARGAQDRHAADAKAQADDAAAPVVDPKATLLVDPKPKKTKAGGGATVDQLAKTALDDADAADKAYAMAMVNLSGNIQDRAALESRIIDDEARTQQAKLAADRTALLKDQKIDGAASDALQAKIEGAQADTERARLAKQQLLANKTAQQLADQANAMAGLRVQGEEEMLRAETALGGTVERRAAIALRLFRLDEQLQEDKLSAVIASKTATDAEKERARLELANLQATAAMRGQLVSNEGVQSVGDQRVAMDQIGLQNQINQLEAEKGVFQTALKRREIALKLFALDEQLQENRLAEVIASKTASDAAKQQAQAQLNSLKSTADLRGQAVSMANPSNAWSAWVQSAQQSTRDVAAAFAQMKVDGIDAFNASLFDSQGKLQSFGTIARSIANKFIVDFEQFSLKSVEAGIFGGGQGKGGNPLSNIGGKVGGLFGLGDKGKGGLGGATTPTGTAMDPIFVSLAGTGGAAAGGAGGGLLGGLGGGGAGGGGLLGGLLGGLGIGGDTSGTSKPTGTVSDPIFVSMAGGGAGGAGGGGGGIMSLLGGGGGASGGGAGDLLSSVGSIFGFAGGGSFTMGGKGGIDQNLALIRMSSGEKATIETPQQQRDNQAGMGGVVHQHFNFSGASEDGFRRTRRQWSTQAKMAMQYV